MDLCSPGYLVSSRDQCPADLWVLEQRHTDHIARTPDPVLLEQSEDAPDTRTGAVLQRHER